MKRDLDLIRKMVLALEEAPDGRVLERSMDGYSTAQVRYHAHLLIDAGLARGVDVTSLNSTGPEALLTSLTWAGHEFAESARDDIRWGNATSIAKEHTGSVTLDYLKQLLVSPTSGVSDAAAQKGERFEREVAAIYRTLGAIVAQDVVLAGNQIDILIDEATSSGSRLRTAIECKAYSRPVGVDVVNQFASLIVLLKHRGLVDRGAVVTSQGFTGQARAAGKEVGLELLEFADLQQQVQGKGVELRTAEIEIERSRIKASEIQSKTPRIFVLMPFASEFTDVYLYSEFAMSQRNSASLLTEQTTSNTTKTYST